ncbi:NADP-dependent oxidoreductase [Prescottella equi]|uniref:NADP-dependent oxidoreductase n=1 Tax=Rhodococcus hoagii TaxID=43767 RepID=UPI000A1207C2|nr:NADP-dependent oxidoreductase [Prescottella equi]ORJ92546.1 NADP-dependent oxidoreductase [Prescottella equi]
MISRALCLSARPGGALRTSDFEVTEKKIGKLNDGEVLIQNKWLSIDPSIRIRLDAVSPNGYLPPFELGEPLNGLALGVVIESATPEFAPGQLVSHTLGYRDLAVVRGGGPTIGGYGGLTAIDPGTFPEQWYLGPLGSSGLTAYAGIIGILDIGAGDTIWVSAAAGAVGSLAAQLARTRGARVIGSAGSPAKVDYLRRKLRLDAAFDYHCASIGQTIAEAAPEGITAYFDSVGGDHLAAALDNLRPGGRIAMCGALSSYDTAFHVPTPDRLFQFVSKGLRMEGFRAGSFNHLIPDVQRELGAALQADQIRFSETIFHGLSSTPAAVVAMLHGENTGKTLVRLDDGKL